jgi:hypothetical protein
VNGTTARGIDVNQVRWPVFARRGTAIKLPLELDEFDK